jgi:hypothetical protein
VLAAPGDLHDRTRLFSKEEKKMLARSRLMVALTTVLISLVGLGLPVTTAGDSWTKYYGGHQNTVGRAVLMADDGGYFIVGTTNLQFEPEQAGNIYLLRADAAGEVVWEKTYGAGYTEGLSITPMSDGNLLISGAIASAETGSADIYLIKVDQNGNELWAKTYGGPLDEMVGGGGQTADGGYILGGNIVDPDDFIADPGAPGYGGFAGRANFYLMKIDGDGNELWSRAYDSEDNILANSGAQTADGGLLALATVMHYPENDDDMVLMKLDGDGRMVWSRTWEEDRISGQAVVQTADGSYLISAAYSPLESAQDAKEDFLFIKVDSEGNEIWRSTFGEPDMIDYGVRLAETADGGYIVVGERVTDLYTWDIELVLVKIDADGQFLWERTKATSHTMLATVFQHSDGGYVIAGSTFRDPMFNIVLIKTDSEGNLE